MFNDRIRDLSFMKYLSKKEFYILKRKLTKYLRTKQMEVNSLDNILLIFLNDLEREEEFNEIINKFDENGYKMYLLDNIKEDKYFSFDNLPYLVEYYKNEHQDVNKVVVLSNSRDLILSWYRCYNSIVDDFIYFIDDDEKNYFSHEDRHFNFYLNLSEFNGIEQETIEGKIYININFNNYEKIIRFLVRKNNFLYFDSFSEFDFTGTKTDKKQLCKAYVFNRYEYIFGINNRNLVEKIKIVNDIRKDFLLNDLFLDNVINNDFIIPYLTLLFYQAKEKFLLDILVILYNKLKKTDKNKKKKIYEELFTYINNSYEDFKNKIGISSLLVMIHNDDERLLNFIMKTLLNDNRYVDYHYEVVTNVMFYLTKENLCKYNDFYLDLRNEIGKLTEWISKDNRLKIPNSKHGKSNIKKIAFVVDQLLSVLHSPTKLMLDYAKNIKKYYPDYKVKIFVEDNLYCKNEIGLIPYLYTSAISSSIKNEHYTYLDDDSIEINYADVNLSKKERTINLVNKITEYSPDVIVTNSDISIINRIFYNRIPIAYISMGGDYFCNLADVYLCVSKKKVIENNFVYKLLNEMNVYEFKYGLEFVDSKKEIKRSDYNLSQNDFVMITVGNRLDAEMDKEFIDYIVKFIIENDNVKWLIVGPREINYIETVYGFLLNQKIIRISYEDDLAALYRICDVYLNPRRKGGGISIAMAMNEGLPIVLTKDSTDGVYYVGVENAVDNDMMEYIDMIKHIKNDIEFRNNIKIKMKKNISNFSMQGSIYSLINIISKL